MRCFRKTIILIICLIFSKSAFAIDKVFEIQEARETITQLNKLYPKPQLENWFGGGGKKSGTFKAQACKNSNKNKEVTYYSGNHTYDVFLACRITSASGYHDHLRTIADKKAIEYCKRRYSSYAYYRGPSYVSDNDDKLWRLVGDAASFGLLINKRTVAVSYACGIDKVYSDSSKSTTTNKIDNETDDLSKMDRKILCTKATTIKGKWSQAFSQRQYAAEAAYRGYTLQFCNGLTGRGQNASDPSKSTEEDLKTLEPKYLCLRSTTLKGEWESRYGKYGKYFLESQRRNFSLQYCNGLTGRGETSSDPKKLIGEDVMNLKPASLCLKATTLDGKWKSKWGESKKFFFEAERRNFSLNYCNSLTGRGIADFTPTEPIEPTKPIEPIEPVETEPTLPKHYYLDVSTLCLRATTKDGKWEASSGQFASFVTEARRRNLSLSECNSVTGRGQSDFIYVILFLLFIIIVFFFSNFRKKISISNNKEQKTNRRESSESESNDKLKQEYSENIRDNNKELEDTKEAERKEAERKEAERKEAAEKDKINQKKVQKENDKKEKDKKERTKDGKKNAENTNEAEIDDFLIE